MPITTGRQQLINAPFWWQSRGVKQVLHEATSPLLYICHSVLPLSIFAASSFHGALENDFRYSALQGDIAEPDQLAPFHFCEKGFLISHEDGGRTLYKIICLLLRLVLTGAVRQTVRRSGAFIVIMVPTHCSAPLTHNMDH